MPAKSDKQRRFMEMCINNPKNAIKQCPSKVDAKKVLGKGESKKKRK